MEEHRLQECPQKWVLAIPFFECHQSGHVFFVPLSQLWIHHSNSFSDPKVSISDLGLSTDTLYLNNTWHFDEQYQLFAFQGSSEHCKKTTSGEKCLPLTSLGLKFRCLFYLSWVLLKHLSFISVSTWTGPKSTRDVPGTETGVFFVGSWGYFIKTKDGALWPARRSPAYSSGRISFCITNSWTIAAGGSRVGAGVHTLVLWQPVSSYHKPWYTAYTAIYIYLFGRWTSTCHL